MKFRLIKVQEFDAAMTMALDEVIMTGIKKGTSVPTIRFYTWKPSAISIGYFQGYKNEVNEEECIKQGVDVVRRITGGGAVYHDTDGEITYSILGPLEEFPKDILKSYEQICGYVVKALEKVGIKGEFSPINDVLVEGKKISGSAQTRRQGVLLQHGTILYDVDVDKMFSLLQVGKEKIADKLIQSVKKRVTRVLDYGDISKEDVAKALEEAFSADFEVEVGEYTPEELAKAKEVSERYKSKQWIDMR